MNAPATRALVICEHDGRAPRGGFPHALQAARQLAPDGVRGALVLGSQIDDVARAAAEYVPVLTVDDESLAAPLADRLAEAIRQVVLQEKIDLLVAAASTWSKDVVSRAAGLLGGAMAGDVTGHQLVDGELLFERPMYAGAVTATVRLLGSPRVVTIRATSYPAAEPAAGPHSITGVAIDPACLPRGAEFERLDAKAGGRPDATESRIVVSGGRAFKTAEDFEQLVGGLADRLGAAMASSRALVDAGITPNNLQVGQTGKVVAPDLYLALGISGAVQHMAGMKNSRIIAAINQDPDAPIFGMANYGLVGDVYELVPRMIEALS